MFKIALIQIALNLIVAPIQWAAAAVALVFIPPQADDWPSWLKWLGDHNYGINGDPYWIKPGASDHPQTDEEARSWWWRLAYVIRNGNWLDYVGAIDVMDIVGIAWTGDPAVSNGPQGVAGVVDVTVTTASGEEYCAHYSIRRYARWPGRCNRFGVGYKLMDVLHWSQEHGGAMPRDIPDQIGDLRPIASRWLAWHPWFKFEVRV